MGGAASTPRSTGGDDVSVEEYLIATFVGEKSFPLASDVWNKLLELPLRSRWPRDRVHQACQLFAQSNGNTRHLAKLLIHLSWCLQELLQASSDDDDDDAHSSLYKKALNATYISSLFLKHLIENGKSEELHLSLDESEPVPHGFVMDQDIQNFVMRSFVELHWINRSEELLNFMVVAMSTQLLSGPSPGPKDANPFLDAAMAQEKSIVCMAVRRLLLNYISRNHTPNAKTYLYSDGDSPGILERVGSAAATFVLLPLNYLVNNTGDGSKYPLAESSLHVLLILIHYQKSILSDESMTDKSDDSATSESVSKVHVFSSGNTFTKALANARDVEFDRSDLEGNAYSGPHVRIPFASLFDTLCMCLSDEGAVLLLYSLLQGNSYFKEYVWCELIGYYVKSLWFHISDLCQDSSFNSSIHKMILPSVPWYKEHLLHQTMCICRPHALQPWLTWHLMPIILVHMLHRGLSVSSTCFLESMQLIPRITQLSDLTGDKLQSIKISLSGEDDSVSEDLAAELQIFTDFLRLVLDILNAILTYALPRNPEIVYAIMHRQEVFQPFKNHPRFHELVENFTPYKQTHKL
ncbi:hypothetical protein HID58_031359 [Brassica napus]|uniref:Dymeclin n=1 Tax=Brassica napus TaxID=3708 RepID=A0ABQ7XFY9_BRANA|nr:hypothetical protein HID58_031359 [Brassica napus]